MRYKLRYGLGYVDIDVPEERVMLFARPKDVRCPDNGKETVELALEHPIGTTKIEAMARGKRNCVIVVDDYSRPTPAFEVLPSVLNRLNKGGISDRDVKVIVAGGTHREMRIEEIERKVGKETMERVGSVTHHGARKMSEEMFTYLGKTSFGAPVFINRSFCEADLKISVDCVIPHHLAGFTGGSKMIMPGLSSSESVNAHHWRSTMEDVKSNMTPVGMVQNSFRRESDEIARMAGLDMLVSVVPDARDKIFKVVAGDVFEAWEVAAKESLAIYGIKIPERAHVVITDGYPYGNETLWKLVMVIPRIGSVLREKGSVALVAPCWEGLAPERSKDLLENYGFSPYERLYPEIERRLTDINAAAACSLLLSGNIVAKSRGWWLFSDRLSREEVEKVHFCYAVSPQDSVDRAIESQPPNARILLMSQSGSLAPMVGAQ